MPPIVLVIQAFFLLLFMVFSGCAFLRERNWAGTQSGDSLYEEGKYHEALQAYMSAAPATLRDPITLARITRANRILTTAQSHVDRAIASARKGEYGEAESLLKQALEIYPRYAVAMDLLLYLPEIPEVDKKKPLKEGAPGPPVEEPDKAPLSEPTKKSPEKIASSEPAGEAPKKKPRPKPRRESPSVRAPSQSSETAPGKADTQPTSNNSSHEATPSQAAKKPPDKAKLANLAENETQTSASVRRSAEEPIETASKPTSEEQEAARAYYEQGLKAFKEGKTEACLVLWKKSYGLDPTSEGTRKKLIDLLTNQGLKLYGQGKLEKAIIKWEEALSIEPGNQEIKKYLQKAISEREKVHTIRY